MISKPEIPNDPESKIHTCMQKERNRFRGFRMESGKDRDKKERIEIFYSFPSFFFINLNFYLFGFYFYFYFSNQLNYLISPVLTCARDSRRETRSGEREMKRFLLGSAVWFFTAFLARGGMLVGESCVWCYVINGAH